MTYVRLAPLEPFGIGTAALESLTSYIRRLALAHVVTPSRLLSAAVLEPLRDRREQHHEAIAPTRATESLNGSGAVASAVRAQLVALTGRAAVASLTFEQVDSCISLRNEYRSDRAWCPVCLAEDATQYDRIAWTLRSLTVCRIHDAPLRDRCVGCDRGHQPLHARATARTCPHCSTPLAGGPSDVAVDARNWTGADLIAAGLEGRLTKEEVTAGFAAAVSDAGGLRALARATSISASELSLLSRGLVRPQMRAVIAVIDACGEPVAAFLGHTGVRTVSLQRGGRPSGARRDPAALAPLVTHALTGPKPTSLRALAKRLETTPRWLRTAFPAAARRIVHRRAAAVRRAAVARRLALLASLRDASLDPDDGRLRRRSVEKRIGRPGYFRAPSVRQEFARLRR